MMADYRIEDYRGMGSCTKCLFSFPAMYIIDGIPYCNFHASKEWTKKDV